MNGSESNISIRSRLFNSLVCATALVLPCVGNAISIDGQSSSISDSLQQRHGRDSAYALSDAPVYRSARPGPERYGRAGGYVGSDRIEMMNSFAVPTTTASEDVESGRTTGNRFANVDTAHGQNELEVQTR